MSLRFVVLASASVLVVAALACATQPPPPTVELVQERPDSGAPADPEAGVVVQAEAGTYTADAASVFRAGEDAMKRNDLVAAEQRFREVKERYAYSRWATIAEIRFGDIAVARGDNPGAVTIYRQWLRDHRSNAELTAEVRAKLDDALKPPAR